MRLEVKTKHKLSLLPYLTFLYIISWILSGSWMAQIIKVPQRNAFNFVRAFEQLLESVMSRQIDFPSII